MKYLAFVALLTSCSPSLLDLDRPVVDAALDHELDAHAVDVPLDAFLCARGFEFDRCSVPADSRPCCLVDGRTTVPLGCGCLVGAVCVPHGRTGCP